MTRKIFLKNKNYIKISLIVQELFQINKIMVLII